MRGINLLPDIHFFMHSILSMLLMETYSMLAHLYSPLHILHSGIRQNAEVHFHIAHTCGNHIECVCLCKKCVKMEGERDIERNQTLYGIPCGKWGRKFVRERESVKSKQCINRMLDPFNVVTKKN